MEAYEDLPDVRADESTSATVAASPIAIAQVTAAEGTRTSSERPTGWAGMSARPPATTADAIDHSEQSRMKWFYVYSVIAPFATVASTLVLGGDSRARILLWIGMALHAACNGVLLWLWSRGERRRWRIGAIQLLGVTGFIPALYYFGPFSAAPMILMLAVMFMALDRSRVLARAFAMGCAGVHAALALPIAANWIEDVGILPSLAVERGQLFFCEGMIIAFLAAGYLLGRWARHTSAMAIAELRDAMRVIGDQQQALAEVKDEQARQNRANEGRWTGQTMGSFKLGLVLGRGAMGEVYEGTAADGRRAAVKLLNQRTTDSAPHVERFYREMAVAAKLESPHIVRVYELSPPDAPVPYIAMERLFGIDLATRLRTESRLPSDELGILLDHVACALEVARKAGVVHRDLKPHNLFFHEGSTWKVLDFGVSKLEASGEGTLTGDGIVGTPQYMAPEQASGGNVTHAADVYALGVIAYRCLTGRAPFKGRDFAELVYQVVHTAPLRPGLLGRVPRAIEDVLAVAMAKDPRRRFPSAQAFAQAFVAARRGRPVALDPPPNAWRQ
jgi:eukaryotic-like serine/threonine-protein kinase